jgi:hypothetical protein
MLDLRAIVIDRTSFSLLLENLRREIVRILDREKKTRQTRIRSETPSRSPDDRSVSSESTIVLARNQSDRVRMSIAPKVKIACPEAIARASIYSDLFCIISAQGKWRWGFPKPQRQIPETYGRKKWLGWKRSATADGQGFRSSATINAKSMS